MINSVLFIDTKGRLLLGRSYHTDPDDDELDLDMQAMLFSNERHSDSSLFPPVFIESNRVFSSVAVDNLSRTLCGFLT